MPRFIPHCRHFAVIFIFCHAFAAAYATFFSPHFLRDERFDDNAIMITPRFDAMPTLLRHYAMHDARAYFIYWHFV